MLAKRARLFDIATLARRTSPGAAATPARERLSRRARWTLVAIQLTLAAAYLGWRALFTLDGAHPIYSVVFLAAEVLFALAGAGFYLTIVERAPARPTLPRQEGVTVDVLIATYNEDARLLRTTAVAARDMEGEHQTYLCDDGRRPEIEALARELGVGYLTRPSNAGYKAGNLNHALGRTSGDLVVVLDADHVPRADFLSRLCGHFRDEQVALVQTPQIAYNVDSFQHARLPGSGATWSEAAIFHHALQPGLDRVNAAFFIGSGAILRRSALERIGGIAEGTITEDILTSMRLHDAGFRTVYVDEPLAVLLAADTAGAYATQRLRWAQGAMTILRTESPLGKRGLTLWQKLAYLQSLGTYLSALPSLLFYLAPALYLLFGLAPLRFDASWVAPVLGAYVLFNLAVYRVLAAPHASLLYSECYKLINLPIFLRALEAFVRPRPRPFCVTPKGANGGLPPMLVVVPLAAICLVNVVAVALALGRLGAPGVLFNLIFAAFFSVASALALLHTFDRRVVDEAFAFVTRMSARAGSSLVRVARLSHDFAYVTGLDAGLGATFELDLRAAGLARPVPALLVARGARAAKLALQGLGAAERDALDRTFFASAKLECARPALPLRSSILSPLSAAQALRSAAVVVFLLGGAVAASASGIADASPPRAFSLADEELWTTSDGFHSGELMDAGWRSGNVQRYGRGGAILRIDGAGCPAACSGRPHAAGELRSRDRQGYGRVEGVLRAARGGGLVTSLFIYTGPSDGAPWDEIDIEILGGDTTVLQTNYFTAGAGGHETRIPLGFDAADRLHRYAFEWTPDAITWLVDGQVVHTETGARGPLPTHPGRVMANLWPAADAARGWAGSFTADSARAEYAEITYVAR